MDQLLRGLNRTIQHARAYSEDWLEPCVLAGYRAAYEQIITLGNHQNPPPTVRTGERGVIKKTPAANLLARLDRDREDVLRFAHDFQIPFNNNLAERDIRMIKIQQKISGCWRTTDGAERFSRCAPASAPPANKAATPSAPSPDSPNTSHGSQPPPAPNHPTTT